MGEVGLVERLGEYVSYLVLAAGPLWVRDLVEVLLASAHEELLVVTRASGGAGVLDPAFGGGRVGKMGVGRLRVIPRNSSTCCRKHRSLAARTQA